jgi:dTDP-4-amino-4,6-dideoxygalactose transaminase
MNFIPLMSPNITDEDVSAVAEVLRSGNLVQGKNVEALENAVAEFLGARNAVAVSSGTATLHLALVALGIGAGDEVIVPAFSYVATANVVEIVGATCVFVDIERDTFNIDVSKIERAITPQTRAIIPVHEFGLACDISAIVEIAGKHDLFVIEDAACALGSTENGKHVGTLGQIGSFSLHPRKNVTSGEGGLLTTNDDELAAKFRQLRNHGIEMRDGKTEFVAAGFNYRMTDFQAALVLSQLRRLEENIRIRNVLAQVYLSALADEKALQLPFVPENKNHIWQTFHVVVDEKYNRDELIAELKMRGVGTNYGAQCIPAVKFYQEKYGLDCNRLFPNALRAYQSGLALPMYDKLTSDDIANISRTLREALK